MNEITNEVLNYVRSKEEFFEKEMNCGSLIEFSRKSFEQSIVGDRVLCIQETKRMNNKGLPNVSCKIEVLERVDKYSLSIIEIAKITKMSKKQIEKIDNLIKEI